ncbi:hypothetical protein J6590_069317 [Homalodisca vitripennis]|nr:hypothetical protein J6590_069317 [Homalodisca vitripennis]
MRRSVSSPWLGWSSPTPNGTYSLISVTQSAHSSTPGPGSVTALASLSTPTLATIPPLASHSIHIHATADSLTLPSSCVHVPMLSSALHNTESPDHHLYNEVSE